MDFLTALENRRSIRKYQAGTIPRETLEQVLQAGLLSVSGRALHPWELVVTENRTVLDALAQCRAHGSQMLEQAGAAIVVLADSEKSDTWIEDSSIVMANMHLMADLLGLGSCWIQGRMRRTADGQTTEQYVRSLLQLPETLRLEAILSLGLRGDAPAPHKWQDVGEQLAGKIHWEKF